MFSWKYIQLVIVLFSLLIMSGCSETDEEKSPSIGTPKLSAFWPKLDGCILCHSPSGQEADGPDMSTPQSFVNNLVGKKKSDYPNWYVTSDCSNSVPFITSGDTGKSTLMAALTQEDSDTIQQNNNCTGSFNIHDTNHANIDSVLRNELAEWINAGALNN